MSREPWCPVWWCARPRGHVITLGSMAGEIAYPNGAVYCGSKAAARFINDGLREDLLGTPVRVTSVDPGLVETEFSEVRFHGDQGRAAKVYTGLVPLVGEDIADVILWAVTRPAQPSISPASHLSCVNQANTLLVHRDQ